MTLEEFDEGLLKWGADLDRWPSTEQSAARALLDTDKNARALLEEMGSFETGLGAAMAVDVNAGAVSARVQTKIHDRADQSGLLSLLPLWRMLGLGSLAGVVGAAVAVILPASVDSSRFLTMALGGGVL